MPANLENQLIEKIKALPPNKQQEALHLLDKLGEGLNSEPTATLRPVWEVINETNQQLPEGAWDEVPTDGSLNVDHYLYGAPKLPS